MAGRQCRSSGMLGSGGTVPSLTTRAELVGRFGGEVPVEAQHVGGVVGRPEDGPGQHGRAEGMQSEPERSDDAEVAAPAPQRPEEIRVFFRARRYDEPSARTTSAEMRLSHARPCFALR